MCLTESFVLQLLLIFSRRVRAFFHFGQHTDHERQQLLHRVETRHLARDHMLVTAVIGRRCPGGLGAKLHHKDPSGRERRLGRWHGRLPATQECGMFTLSFA